MKTFFFSVMIFCFLNHSALAQHGDQPLKESSDDLRTNTTMFSIEDLPKEASFWLERTASMDYFLRAREGKNSKVVKISVIEAKKLDMEFAGKYLKCQYELPPSAEGCKVTLRLTMKGEGQDICGVDDKKSREFVLFVDGLQKRF